MGSKTSRIDDDCRRKILLVSLFVLLIGQLNAQSREINCRKYVFMPECRGIAAKRDTRKFDQQNRLPRFDKDSPEADKILMQKYIRERAMLGDLIMALKSNRDNEYPKNDPQFK